MSSPERSLALYRFAYPLTGNGFWAPVFFLYMSSRFPVERVLQLEAVYYATVFLLEIPSGYLSDRVSRILTLRLSAAAGCVGFLLFVFGGSSFALFAGAQVSLAVFYSFLSGTDASYHYDTLAALGRADEYGEREARLQRNKLVLASTSALLGGLAAALDLRLAYVLSLVGAVGLLGLLLLMADVPRRADEPEPPGFVSQLGLCMGLLKRPFLLWIFAYVILQTTLEHIPYEFAQPYLALLLGESAQSVERTPIVTGVLWAIVAAIGAVGAGRSMQLVARFGVGPTLIGVTVLQTGIIAAMASAVHVLVVPLLLLRSLQPGIGHVVVNASITPRVPRGQRATFLSIHSLAGRMGFTLVLVGLSAIVAGREADPAALRAMLGFSGLLGAAGLVALWLSRAAVRESGT